MPLYPGPKYVIHRPARHSRTMGSAIQKLMEAFAVALETNASIITSARRLIWHSIEVDVQTTPQHSVQFSVHQVCSSSVKPFTFVHEADIILQARFSTSLLVCLPPPQVVRHFMLPNATIQNHFGTAAMAIKMELAAMIRKTICSLPRQQLPRSQDPLRRVLNQGFHRHQRARPQVTPPRVNKPCRDRKRSSRR